MFAPKQKALTLPSRTELNNLWLQARKKIGSSARLQINSAASTGSSNAKPVHLSVQCYRSSTQPKWQLELTSANADNVKTLLTSDLATVSSWIADTLAASNVIDISARRQAENIDLAAIEPPDENLGEPKKAAIAGDLSQMTCSGLLQALSLGMVTGQLTIDKTALITFWQGRITTARLGSLSGKEALSEIALLKTGQFSFASSNENISKNLSIPLHLVLIQAAHKEDQLALLTDQADFAGITAALTGKLANSRAQISQSNLSGRFIRHGGRNCMVFGLEVIKLLKNEQLSLAELQSKTTLSRAELTATMATLVRSGMAELYSRGEGQPQAAPNKNAQTLAQAAAAFCRGREESGDTACLDLIDSANNQLQEAIDKETCTAMVLVRGLLSSTAAKLLTKIKGLLRREDAVHLVDDDQILVVMQGSSTEAAHFVRRLRQESSKLLFVNGNKVPTHSLYQTAVVSAPEDGRDINTLLDRVSLAFEVSKRLGTDQKPSRLEAVK